MKRKMGLLAGLAVVVMVLVGCATTREDLGRFSIISSKNIDLSRFHEMKKATHNPLLGDTRERISQTSNKQLNAKFLFISYRKVSENYQLENALDNVLHGVPGGIALVDAKLAYITKRRFTNKYWGYIFEGTVLVDPQITGANQAKLEELAPDGKLYGINSGDNGEITFVDEATFNKLVASVK